MSRNILDIKGLFNHKYFSFSSKDLLLTNMTQEDTKQGNGKLIKCKCFFSFLTSVYDEVNFVDIFSLFLYLSLSISYSFTSSKVDFQEQSPRKNILQ